MHVIRKLSLDRRSFLRGVGCSLALPCLGAMQPALTADRAAPRRAVFVFAPNGMDMPRWRPDGEGRGARFGETLAPLQSLRARLTVFSGLTIDGGRPHGDGPGDHARAAASYLTCAHPRKTGGKDIHVGVSVDQRLAAQIGHATRLPSLELGMERGRSAGICDSGYSCAYSNNISWRTPRTPVAKETDPRAVFGRLFGDPGEVRDAEAARKRGRRDRSILDAVQQDADALTRKLGATDRRKLDEFLSSVRALELRLEKLDEDVPEVPLPDGLLVRGAPFADRLALMYDVHTLALASDSTRIVSFMLGNAGSNRSYRALGVPEGHHNLSHHGKDPGKRAKIGKINRFHVEQFARFLDRLAGTQEERGDLLSSCFVVFGSGISDGNRHNHDDLPVLLAGEGGGAARGRGHVRHARETPMADLYLAILRGMEVGDEPFADSRGVLALR